MNTLLTLAWRNLWRKKRRTLITVSSVMFATILAIILMSMVSGVLQQTINSLLRNSTGYLQIQDALYHEEPSMDHALEYGEEVKKALSLFDEKILYTVPRLSGFCLASKELGARGAMVVGIHSDKENKMNQLSSKIVQGEMFQEDDTYALVAQGLAEQLALNLGDTIVLLGQGFQGATAAGKFMVGGIVEFFLPEQNNAMVYLPLKQAQWLFSAPDRLTNLIIMVEDESIVEDLAAGIQKHLDDEWFAVKTWHELMPDFLVAFEVREAQVKVFAWVLYIVAGFGIFGTIVTMVYERLKEFGILLSVGLKRSQLAFICMLETLFVSLLGVLAGIVAGFPITLWLYKNPIALSGELADVMTDMGIEPYMGFSIAPEIYIYQAFTIFFIALVVGMYPVGKVFRMDIVSAARD